MKIKKFIKEVKEQDIMTKDQKSFGVFMVSGLSLQDYIEMKSQIKEINSQNESTWKIIKKENEDYNFIQILVFWVLYFIFISIVKKKMINFEKRNSHYLL